MTGTLFKPFPATRGKRGSGKEEWVKRLRWVKRVRRAKGRYWAKGKDAVPTCPVPPYIVGKILGNVVAM